MFGLGVFELVLVFFLVMLSFGAKRIPLIARGLGESIRNFKGAIGDGSDDNDNDNDNGGAA